MSISLLDADETCVYLYFGFSIPQERTDYRKW
jgi:hypothetical protein